MRSPPPRSLPRADAFNVRGASTIANEERNESGEHLARRLPPRAQIACKPAAELLHSRAPTARPCHALPRGRQHHNSAAKLPTRSGEAQAPASTVGPPVIRERRTR